MSNKLFQEQRAYFDSGITLSYAFRKNALLALERSILEHESEIEEALYRDLGKPPLESYFAEIGMVLEELSYHRRHLHRWMKKRFVRTPLSQFRSDSYTLAEPYGVALILSPWNYPFQLSIEPLIGAISAGNCAIVKPSAYSPHTSAIVNKLIRKIFPEEYIAVVQGGRKENEDLFALPFDKIFFTGSTAVGKIVMEKAATHLTPVTLELSGKSPVIVDPTANLPLTARRIIWGKLLNAGQTCIAPDYMLVHSSVKDNLVQEMIRAIDAFFPGGDYSTYSTIINDKHFDRICALIATSHILYGGQRDKKTRRILPTLVDGVGFDSPIMQEEIFGPVLPILTYDNVDNMIRHQKTLPKPLALYVFSKKKTFQEHITTELSFGGGCINDTLVHHATSHMPFGGVGDSGMGGYHGKASFDTFSHTKSIVKKHDFPDLTVRYRPYTELKQRIARLVIR